MTMFLIRFTLKWVVARLQEKSTYAGLFVLLAGHLGLYFSPEMQGAITQTLIDGAGAALVALSGQDAVRHLVASGSPAEVAAVIGGAATIKAFNDSAAKIAAERGHVEPTADDRNAAEAGRHGG